MDRRTFIAGAASALADTCMAQASSNIATPENEGALTTLFLGGDVMTGRGIDQIMPTPSRPKLYESSVRSALQYVELGERANGPIPRQVSPSYVWGDALAELARVRPAARIVNLETAVTTSEDAWPGKGIHYRMHPANIGCLAAAGLDCCALANNHVLDWGYRGLAETITALRAAGIRTAGAGANRKEASVPAIVDLTARRRIVVFAFGMETAGVPEDWAATGSRAGVAYLPNLTPSTVDEVAARVHGVRRDGDIVVASIHWGGNWGYEVPSSQRTFARQLVDRAGVDVVHGHSSHHPKAIEVHRDRLILYGCGDFLNDYEGISGYERFRSELGFMYFPAFGASGALEKLTLVPTRIRRFRVDRARGEDAQWLAAMLTREGARFGARVAREADESLTVHWR